MCSNCLALELWLPLAWTAKQCGYKQWPRCCICCPLMVKVKTISLASAGILTGIFLSELSEEAMTRKHAQQWKSEWAPMDCPNLSYLVVLRRLRKKLCFNIFSQHLTAQIESTCEGQRSSSALSCNALPCFCRCCLTLGFGDALRDPAGLLHDLPRNVLIVSRSSYICFQSKMLQGGTGCTNR